ncbi:MAG: transcription antitermination factor NusB [Clostridia bacterium]|nr:transcription antitermination factor NusB [Clostridia bacterium]
MSRRKAREKALQAIFQIDLGRTKVDNALESVFQESQLTEKDKEFVERIVKGTTEHLPEIDAHLQEYAAGWSLDRMPNVDRNIMRLALYELLYGQEASVNVIINEAVELARRYSTEESSAYINGVLDTASKNVGTKGNR